MHGRERDFHHLMVDLRSELGLICGVLEVALMRVDEVDCREGRCGGDVGGSDAAQVAFLCRAARRRALAAAWRAPGVVDLPAIVTAMHDTVDLQRMGAATARIAELRCRAHRIAAHGDAPLPGPHTDSGIPVIALIASLHHLLLNPDTGRATDIRCTAEEVCELLTDARTGTTAGQRDILNAHRRIVQRAADIAERHQRRSTAM